ncbi:MAG TPA: tetratricopeptide repeat protein [Streptosporangiaceae bacterium]|nr:tetratricopeptide repeat protein [Streptosporangiaceae bacterium]
MPGDEASLRVQLLGPVRAWWGERELDLGPPQQRAVLAVLAQAAGKAVSRHELIDAVWDSPRDTADGTLFTYVSRLRAVLEPEGGRRARGHVLASSGSGYVLQAAPGQVDAGVFAAQMTAARRAREAGDLAGAAEALETALGLWQGTAFAGIAGLWAQAERDRLSEARLVAVEEQAALGLALGRHGEVAAELAGLVGRYPLREGLRYQLMLALYRSGRQAESLAVFHDTRHVLDAELGIVPGHALRQLHEQVLAADPALAAPAEVARADPADMDALARRPVPVPRELPSDVAAFTGRAAELAVLDHLLLRTSLPAAGPALGPVVVSAVSGTAGVGKTALAVRWAHRVATQFPDGQLYLNLRGYDPAQPVPATEALAQFLRALGVAAQDIPLAEAERAARYRSVVAGKRLLVLLDNAATEEQVRPLLPGTPTVMVVVTSRDSLAGLVARDGALRLDLDLLPSTDAVELLRTLIGDRVDTDPVAAQTLAGQCARLPLALRVAAELAAARPDTPLADLATELAGQEDRLEMLSAGGDPYGGVATVFSWSCRHLAPDAVRMFRLLGLHPGTGFDTYAAAALTATTIPQASRLLGALARAHLVQPTGAGRYGMHDLLQAYGAGLAAADEGEAPRQAALTRLFDYYLATCVAAVDTIVPAERSRRPQPPLIDTPAPEFGDRVDALTWLDTELANLTSMAAHTASHGWPDHTTRLAATLHRYLSFGHTEALTIYTHALEAARDQGDLAAQARTLINLGQIHLRQGRDQDGTFCYRQALSLARKIGDQLLQARASGSLGVSHLHQSRYPQAISRYQQALALYRAAGDQVGQAVTLTNLGQAYRWQGRYELAAESDQQALSLFRDLGHRHGEAAAHANLGEVCYLLGQHERATEHLQQARTLSHEHGDRRTEAYTLTVLGGLCHRQGDYPGAAASHRQALALLQEIGEREGEAGALNGAGETLLATGQPHPARTCHTNALTLSHHLGDRHEQARALARLGEVCHHLRHYGEAADYQEQALALFREIGDSDGESDVLNGSGETLLATGQPEQARTCHSTALTLARQTGHRYQEGRAHEGLANACHATGDLRQARKHWQHALDTYTDLGVPDASRVQASPAGLGPWQPDDTDDAPGQHAPRRGPPQPAGDDSAGAFLGRLGRAPQAGFSGPSGEASRSGP